MKMLTDAKARKLNPGDKPCADGTVAGLWLHAGKVKGHGKWSLRFTSPTTGKRRDMGLGTYPEAGIAEARQTALAARERIRSGIDPIDARNDAKRAEQRVSDAMSFEAAARQCHKELRDGWSNGKHVEQWINTLAAYAFPVIGNRKIEDLRARDFADVLRPIWLEKAETASRVKQRCSTVMDWCVAQELIDSNPVGVVTKLLPKQAAPAARVTSHPAMPWADIPQFADDHLRAEPRSVTKSMLEFLILTAARSGEVRSMTWGEVDLENRLWTVPATRMKAKRLHRVPLSDRSVEILEEQIGAREPDALVFSSPRGQVMSDMALTKYLRDVKAASSDASRTATAHGFRSSFRDWASENGYSRDLAERALAHTIKDKTESAYHRTDLLEQRRAMMEAWSDHVCGLKRAGGEVVPIRKSA